ncbi:MAG: hypothetical protein HY875_00030 [Chloroflexi bacterium]|nr:hypothetical protein [Chloroflexota bacterium]
MTTSSEPALQVQYEGGGVGTELWGMTQANFLVHVPNDASREVAVMVNDAAAAFLASRYGQDDTPEFRKNLARVVGRLWIEALHAEHGRISTPVLVISRATFDEQPGLLAEVDRAVQQ